MHTIPDIIRHFSTGTTLEAGDVIMTGTPSGTSPPLSAVLNCLAKDQRAGVGYARDPPVWLKDGDSVEIQIQGIGTLRHSIKFDDA